MLDSWASGPGFRLDFTLFDVRECADDTSSRNGLTGGDRKPRPLVVHSPFTRRSFVVRSSFTRRSLVVHYPFTRRSLVAGISVSRG